MRSGLLLAALAAISIPVRSDAQFYSYPSFQAPRISMRDFNFATAVAGDAGTSLMFQWRENAGTYTHLQLDAGLGDPKSAGAKTRFVVGGTVAYQPTDPSADFPIDIVLTGGVGASFGTGTSLLRIPVGASVGHRFQMDPPIALTPYVHPRVSLGVCTRCGTNGDAETKVGIDIDIGLGMEISETIEIRASAGFAGSHNFARDDSFGLSLVWKPRGVR